MGIAAQLTREATSQPAKLREPFTEFRPLGSRVVIHQDEAVKVSSGGIEIPDEAQKKPSTGTVIAVGPEVGYDQVDAAQVRVGDRVVYSKYSGTVISLKVGHVLCIDEKDVYGILEAGSTGEVAE